VVPKHFGSTGEVKKSIRRCSRCREPISAHPGTQYVHGYHGVLWSERDIAKTRNWCGLLWKPNPNWRSPPPHWNCDRELLFSVRLATLFAKLKIRGLTPSDKKKPTADDLAWVEARISRIEGRSKAAARPRPEGVVTAADKKWYDGFLRRHVGRKEKLASYAALEKKYKFKVPVSYKTFLASSAPRTFQDIDDHEGFVAHLLPPEKFDFQSFRHGKVPNDDDSPATDGIMFACTEHGDGFCFAVREGQEDYAVYLYDYEQTVSTRMPAVLWNASVASQKPHNTYRGEGESLIFLRPRRPPYSAWTREVMQFHGQ
jgi:hypothetical protein